LTIWSEVLSTHPLLSDGEKRRVKSIGEVGDASVLREHDYSEELIHSEYSIPALLTRGDASCLHRPCVAIVGTRSSTPYGRLCARKFGEELARAGVTVVSGGAVGIDAAAHEGALSVGGSTVAVLANGVDHVYPPSHSNLFDRMQERGLLISQYGLGTKPADYKFIQRNQLIAALSIGVVVIEAPTRSGAIRTASYAAELGREVFVVPGQIDQFGFQGSHALIKDGATLVDHPNQIIDILQIERNVPVAAAVAEGDAGLILGVLGSDSFSVEKISELTGLEPGNILAELTILELEGLVMREAGGFVRPL
jgi:DNA processing protein